MLAYGGVQNYFATMFTLPLVLTLLGALPFIGLAALLYIKPVWGDAILFYYAFVTYGAIILTFLAGIHWGLAVAFGRHQLTRVCRILLIWSNVVALSAWIALLMFEYPLAIPLLAVGFAVQWLMDRRLYQTYFIPIWFIRIRNLITPIVLVACLVAYLSLA